MNTVAEVQMKSTSDDEAPPLDQLDKAIINRLQDGFPICDRPYRVVADELGTTESILFSRLQALLDNGYLSRFGPMYHAEQLGGGLTLAAMKIPEDDFERVNAIVNGFDEVAHNYQRTHAFNMWFVLATETPEGVADICQQITAASGYPVYNMPKQKEFYIGLRFQL